MLTLLAAASASSLYNVQFAQGVDAAVRAAHVAELPAHVALGATFRIGDVAGYTASFASASAAAAHLAASQRLLQRVERDVAMHAKGALPSCYTQKNVPSWGLARVSEKKPPLDGTYRFEQGVGAGADIYVLDTGVRTTHKQFSGRASFGHNAAGGKVDTDTDGHGTFVAGVAAATEYGVCKLCSVISVKVFTDGGDCSAAILIKAFDWVAAQYKAKPNRTVVINVSVGGDPGETSDVMDAAVNALVAMGVHVVGAAGNENTDACTESPGRAARIIAVGSSVLLAETSDYFLGGSNFGKCVSLFAPGDKIVSLGISSDTAVGVTDSGTSFSSPHVAGALARLASSHPDLGVAAVQGMLMNATLKGAIGGVPKGTANLLLHQECA